MSDHQKLEAIASEVIRAFNISAPPIPIESMLHRPVNQMWEELDINQLSGSFLSIKDRYSPRMSLARLLARHIASSPWGKERGLAALLQSEEDIQSFARMLIMPAEMVEALTSSMRNPSTVGLHFEVPEEDALLRLQELL